MIVQEFLNYKKRCIKKVKKKILYEMGNYLGKDKFFKRVIKNKQKF